jgi:hypothetical protein
MSDEPRPRYDPNRPPMSPESQLRLLLGGIAIVLFVIAGWIFLTYGDASRGLMWLSFGLAAVAGCVMIPPPPAK